VKTDRRDALKLRAGRAGGEGNHGRELTAVRVPEAESTKSCGICRGGEGPKKDQLRARHRLSKYLLRDRAAASVAIKNA